MPRSGKVGASRQGEVQAASSRGGVGKTPYILSTSIRQFLPTKLLHFLSLPENTIVYRNILINIPQLDESKFLASCFQMCWDGGVSDTSNGVQ